jgi:hypothetical protein
VIRYVVGGMAVSMSGYVDVMVGVDNCCANEYE